MSQNFIVKKKKKKKKKKQKRRKRSYFRCLCGNVFNSVDSEGF
jgi:hypothetical protein